MAESAGFPSTMSKSLEGPKHAAGDANHVFLSASARPPFKLHAIVEGVTWGPRNQLNNTGKMYVSRLALEGVVKEGVAPS